MLLQWAMSNAGHIFNFVTYGMRKYISMYTNILIHLGIEHK